MVQKNKKWGDTEFTQFRRSSCLARRSLAKEGPVEELGGVPKGEVVDT
jgi:hypothetical protein